LGVEWVREPVPEAEIMTLIADLRRRRIAHAFVFVSHLRSDGDFDQRFSNASRLVDVANRADPSLRLYAWVGLPLDGLGEQVDLRNGNTRQKVVSFCSYLVRDVGFGGVHIDPEPVRSDDRGLLLLLEDVRSALAPDAVLSVATRRIWPLFPHVRWPLVGRFAWGSRYYSEVAERADQIAVMTYDSALPSALLYRLWVRAQVVEISRAVARTDVQVFIGIPTSEERTWTHRPNAETIEAGLAGVVDGLRDRRACQASIAGVAVYPYWETDDDEWRAYEELWLGEGNDESAHSQQDPRGSVYPRKPQDLGANDTWAATLPIPQAPKPRSSIASSVH
jgi:hypothetical protein